MIIKLVLNVFKLSDRVVSASFGVTLIYFTDVVRMLVRRFEEVYFALERCVVLVEFLVIVSSLPCFMELRFQLRNYDILLIVYNSLLSGLDVEIRSGFHLHFFLSI